MSIPYTQGVWHVQAGRADEFVAAWTAFAEWTAANAEGAGRGVLLRDADDDHRFVSIGPWESLAAIDRWRQLPEWQKHVGRMRAMLDGFEPSTLMLVAETG